MGCDIHMVVERHTPNGWVGVHNLPYIDEGAVSVRVYSESDSSAPSSFFCSWYARQRNYELFALLAGVRGGGPEPKGMPSDASPLAQMEADSWGGDGHSHSYCSAVEFAQAYIKTLNEEEKLTYITKKITEDEEPAAMLANQLFSIEKPELHRIVFWFDN